MKLKHFLHMQDLAAHVMYRLTRVRLMANLLAFSVTDIDNAAYRAALQGELGLLRDEYRTLLYGGPMLLQVSVCEGMCHYHHALHCNH
jgi:hypothetical protein